MRKLFLLVGIVLAVTVTAQTKVSKQIKVLDWLNTAVVDGNQVEGGLHSYDTWATLGSRLKTAHIKVGMLVTITGETDAIQNGTFRLKSWATKTALPLASEWERVSELVVVADIAARDALLSSGHSIAPGTTVVVKSNAKKLTETFLYAAGLFDANGDGQILADGTDNWYSPTSATTAAETGYVFISQQAIAATPTVDLTNGIGQEQLSTTTAASTPASITVGTTTRIGTFPATGIDYVLTAGTNVPVVALPAAWNNPTFYLSINDGTTTTVAQLNDCWVKSYQTLDGVKYQVWAVDNAFLNGIPAGTTLTLQIR